MIQSVNFLNALPKKEVVKLPAKLIVKIWVGFLILLMLVYGYGYWQKGSLAGKLAKVRQTEQSLSTQLLALNKKLPSSEQLQSNEDLATRLARELDSKAELVAVLKRKKNLNMKGFSRYLEAFSKEVTPGAWLKTFSLNKGGETIHMEGEALSPNDVFNFMSRLDDSKVLAHHTFKLINLKTPAQGDEQTTVSFELGTDDA